LDEVRQGMGCVVYLYPTGFWQASGRSNMSNMAAAVVSVSDIVENLTYNKGLLKDACCKKRFDQETQLQEALKELSSAHLIIELLRNEVTIEKESTGKQRDSVSVEK